MTLRDRRALRLATEACAAVGLSSEGARVFRQANAVLVELPAADAMARVDDGAALNRAHHQVKVAEALRRHGVPAAYLLHADKLPYEGEGGAVTLWEHLGAPLRMPTGTELGELAAAMAAVDATGFEPINPFAEIDGHLALCPEGEFFPGMTAFREKLEAIRDAWPTDNDNDHHVLVHGDLHEDNVIVTPDGPKIIDLEFSGRASPALELAAHVLAVRRYGRPQAYLDDFAAAYGVAPEAPPHAQLAYDLNELLATAWAVAWREASPEIAREAKVRMGTLRGEDHGLWILA
jgi:hypothetical protein